jgi:DNA-binding GntR family transcriptional regulator
VASRRVGDETANLRLLNKPTHQSGYRFAAGLGVTHGRVPDLWDLRDLVTKASGHVERLRRLQLPTAGKTEWILRDHRTIVRCIEARDPASVQSALRQHLSGTLSAVDEICRQYPDSVTL